MMPSDRNLARSVCKTITNKAIAAMKPGDLLLDGSADTRTGQLRILRKITTKGVVTAWLFSYWNENRSRNITISLTEKSSKYSPTLKKGFLTISQAKAIARRMQLDVQAGRDPMSQRKDEKTAAQNANNTEITEIEYSKNALHTTLIKTNTDASTNRSMKFRSAQNIKRLVHNRETIPYPVITKKPSLGFTLEEIEMLLKGVDDYVNKVYE